MRIHILGICGTFMGGVAALAKAAGHQVSGSDENVYPPMSTQLRKLGIRLHDGYDAAQLSEDLDCVLVGNVMRRGNPAVEALLESGLPYYSGPEWLAENVLKDKWVFAVAGTHGKTTATSMLAWILDYAGLAPGFLVGGVPRNFSMSAHLSRSKYFVVEADEYDTAFFDKRAKFVHYRPRTLAITNIEFDHADIYPDLDAILRQFRQLLRTIPGRGLITANGHDPNIAELLSGGAWTPVETFSARDDAATWSAKYDLVGAKSRFSVYRHGEKVGQTGWALIGPHNLENALAAIGSAVHAGVSVELALEALSQFQGVKRRLEKRGVYQAVSVYEDFAHHPTAIAATLSALRAQHKNRRIIAVVEPRSNSMRMGVHEDALRTALDGADRVFMLASEQLDWNPESAFAMLGDKVAVEWDVDALLGRLTGDLARGDQVVLMSNGNFGGLPRLLQQALKSGNVRVAGD
ncbi:UDP-N-acetylmuramate:L-alanyl-gamma-D-glutamyl-meso-diaminopimelate ligase [Candidatus Rariloculus sp.]|uniref:UDP-N-acetylmuramate:L-alanyl-gamma-D-glutamyl- meso-diaminopimelate ligase n=1 Tax=Candidatus Rariloculus sp. TaxID=3101265 RepID=UPI003D0A4ADF